MRPASASPPRPWKPAIVITRSDTIAGVQVHVRDLAEAMIARDHRVTVLAGGEGPFLDDLTRNRIPFRAIAYLVRPMDRSGT